MALNSPRPCVGDKNKRTGATTLLLVEEVGLRKEIRRIEIGAVRKHVIHVLLVHSEPLSESLPDGFPARRRDETSAPNVLRAVVREIVRILAENAPAAHGAAARRLTAGRSAFAHAAPPSIKRAFAARRASASRATHVLTTAGWNDFEWGTATVVSNEPAAAEGGLRSVKVSVDEACAEAYGTPGQFVQMRTNADAKPAFLAIASPPRAEPKTVLELLIKSTEGTAGEICALKQGATVDVSPPMGGGFDLEGKAPAAAAPKALLFATGSGISPVRALIKSGALDGRDVSLFYGTTSERTCAFFEEFADWKRTHGVAVTHVQSQVGGPPTYVQDALKDVVAAGAVDADATCAVLCGQKEMTEAVIAILTEAGVPKEKCIMNF